MPAGGSLLTARQAGGIGREEGANSSSQVLALGCILETAPVPLGASGRDGGWRGPERAGEAACRLSALAVKTLVFHDVGNQLGSSGRRPLSLYGRYYKSVAFTLLTSLLCFGGLLLTFA